MIEGTIITISGLYIIYVAIEKGINGATTSLLAPAIWVMILSIVVTFALVQYLLRVAKQTDNLVIKSDALHYKTDLWSNGVILLALGIVQYTGWEIIDAIFGFGIGIYIIYSAYEIIKEGVLILLDHALDKEMLAKIGKIIDAHKEVNGFHWLKTRTDGTTNFVEFHLVLQPNLYLIEAHRISDEIEDEIMALEPNKPWIITPHYDPFDDSEINNYMATKKL
ncbi:Cobalt-zinc-cadmium resistance protein [hydrothermal vent metagenome]|uniref:Cobalt-zinc-cadmium resistance protein n=1 Tax=hydrothermal vent metagenome TaxID=652676 RepID=A0A1W1C335_9ZZZZ